MDYAGGFCDVCREAHVFTSKQSRDKWQELHLHEPNLWVEDMEAGAIG